MKKLIAIILLSAVLTLFGCNAPSGTSASPLPSDSASSSPAMAPSPSQSPAMQSPATPSPSQSVLTVADYFPLTPNVHMSYLGIGMEFAGFESYVDYLNNGAIQLRTNNTGTETVNVYKIGNGALTKVFMQHETYYQYDFTDQNTMNEVMIMEPIAVGTAWTLESGEQRSITATDVSVTVPLGTFSALEVTTEYEESTVKDYYVQDIGLVKRDFTTDSDPEYHITSELQAMTSEPLVQTVRFFYGDTDPDKTVYIDKSIEFYTDDTVASILEAGFRDIPAGSEIGRVLTENTKINSIAYDLTSGVVTIDLSKAFIVEMNLGASYEGQRLECIGNTLGVYFQTDKVAITIDGGPYESGHIVLSAGDYLPYHPENAVQYIEE